MTPDEPPPILGTWKNLYVFVIGELVLLMVILWALGRWAS